MGPPKQNVDRSRVGGLYGMLRHFPKEMKGKSFDKSDSQIGVPEALRERGLAVPERWAFDWGQVAWFFSFLKENADFFSEADRARILERHLYESLWMAGESAARGWVSRETRVADAGSGPGLPGYLYHCLEAKPEVTLWDSSRRRLGRLEKAAVGQERLRFRYERLEETRAPTFDFVTIRALIPFPFCVELVSGLVTVGGRVLYAAASDVIPEAAGEFLDRLGFVSRETIAAPELAFLGQRCFYLLAKTRRTPQAFPRPWKELRKAIETWEKSSPSPTKRAESAKPPRP